MGDSILPMIKLEEDVPSNHSDQKLPILDLKVWIQEGNKLYYQFYRKPMAQWLLMPAMSAMPRNIKRTALTQYGLRILRNTKPELEWTQTVVAMSDFSERMRDSGYGERFGTRSSPVSCRAGTR